MQKAPTAPNVTFAARAPKARNRIARGKREAKRARRPWFAIKRGEMRPERPKYYYALSGL